MADEAKAGEERTHQAEEEMPKYPQSSEPIPKVVPPRGSKDQRSFRPSTLKEINMMNNYQPLEITVGGKTYGIGCGNSLEDLLLIFACFFALWSFLLGICSLLVKAMIDTTEHHTALWTFFWLFALFVLMMMGMIATGYVEKNNKERLDAEEKMETELTETA